MIGVDIVKVSRIKKIIDQFGEKFIKRFFHPEEIKKYKELCQKTKINYLAKRFAAKEAFLKSKGSGASIRFKNICTKNNKLGKPILFYNERELKNTKISLSDDGDYAIAFLITIPC
jgi:holo-[acyl-carrier protein] synthase